MDKIIELKGHIESATAQSIAGWDILALSTFSEDLFRDYYDLTGHKVDRLIKLMREAKIGVVP